MQIYCFYCQFYLRKGSKTQKMQWIHLEDVDDIRAHNMNFKIIKKNPYTFLIPFEIRSQFDLTLISRIDGLLNDNFNELDKLNASCGDILSWNNHSSVTLRWHSCPMAPINLRWITRDNYSIFTPDPSNQGVQILPSWIKVTNYYCQLKCW